MSSPGQQQVVDRFGHSGYAVVILAPADVQREIELVRRQLEIPIHMIPAHVTVKGTFINPPSVEEVGTIVEGVARATQAFIMETGEALAWGSENARTAVISVCSSDQLDDLHRQLFSSIEPTTTNVYGPERAEGFRFHMTVYQEVDEANHMKGQALVASLSVPERMAANSVCLMGRSGPRGPRGVWHVIEEFPLR